MPVVHDFRDHGFDYRRIDRSGRFVGQRAYWKLYAIENLLRVFMHSALSAQIAGNWWDVAVDPEIRKKARRVRENYRRSRWHTSPGRHDIYCVFLPDLNNIIRANSNLLLPLVPDIDSWIVRIEEVRLPRNLVGHMNFPATPDRQKIDEVYRDMPNLINCLRTHGTPVQIP